MKSTTLCLTVDIRSNIKNNAVVDYMAAFPNWIIILEAVQTDRKISFLSWFTKTFEACFQRAAGKCLHFAAKANTNFSRKTFELFKAKNTSCFVHGCTFLGTYFLVEENFWASKSRKVGTIRPIYVLDYLFSKLLHFVNKSKDIFKFYYNHLVIRSQLQEMQKPRIPNLFFVCPPALRNNSANVKNFACFTTASARYRLGPWFRQTNGSSEKEPHDAKEAIMISNFSALMEKAVAIL